MKLQENDTGFFKGLQIMHRAMLSGMIVFAAIIFFLNYSGNFSPALASYNEVLQVAVVLLSLAGFFLGNFLFKKKIASVRELAVLPYKLSVYRVASLIQWALLEVPALFAIVCFLLVGNYAFLALALALVLLFVIVGPSKIKIAMLLQVREEDIH
jgi:hypothetical protein